MNVQPSFQDFLEEQKEQYLAAIADGRGHSYTVVMGNEAGDLDSLVSALGYAWLATTLKNSPTVPLTQTPRENLRLRPENLYALELAGLSNSGKELLCSSDLPSPKKPFPSHQFALVDHNRIMSDFTEENPSARVVAVVDHHDDEGLYKDTADLRLIVVPTGSCASLVAQLIEKEKAGIPQELAKLLLSAILVDTNGLKPGGKAKDTDYAAASFLYAHSSDEAPPQIDPGDLYEVPALQKLNEELQAKKEAVADLGTRDLLRRDFKEYTFVPSWSSDPSSADAPSSIVMGLASVPVGLKEWIKSDHSRDGAFWRDARSWTEERSLDGLGIFTSFRDEEKLNKKGKPKHRREQMWILRPGRLSEGLAERLWPGLETNAELELKRVGLDYFDTDEDKDALGEGWEMRVYKQKNTDSTRKVTAPVVKSIIEG